jgi:hypothetical protein
MGWYKSVAGPDYACGLAWVKIIAHTICYMVAYWFIWHWVMWKPLLMRN